MKAGRVGRRPFGLSAIPAYADARVGRPLVKASFAWLVSGTLALALGCGSNGGTTGAGGTVGSGGASGHGAGGTTGAGGTVGSGGASGHGAGGTTGAGGTV